MSDIQLDNDMEMNARESDSIPSWAVALVIVPFVCFLVVLVLQFMEYQYYRGTGPSETDPYAAPVMIPSS